jgi:hypothetical protein
LRISIDMLARTFTAGMLSWLDPEMVLHNPQLVPWFNVTGANPFLRTVTCCTDGSDPAVATTVFTRAMLRSQYVNLTYGGAVSLVYEQSVVNLFPLLAIPPSCHRLSAPALLCCALPVRRGPDCGRPTHCVGIAVFVFSFFSHLRLVLGSIV